MSQTVFLLLLFLVLFFLVLFFLFFVFCLFVCLFVFFFWGGRVQISMIDNRGRLFPLLRQSLFVVLPRLRWCSQRRFLAQYHVTTLLGHCFEWLQHCSNIATLCCAKNRRCESSRVTSPLGSFSKDDGDRRRQQKCQFLKFAFFKTLSRLFQFAKNVKGRREGLDVKAQLKGVLRCKKIHKLLLLIVYKNKAANRLRCTITTFYYYDQNPSESLFCKLVL